MDQEVAFHDVVSGNLLQRVNVLKCFSVAVRGEEVLDDLQRKQDFADPRDRKQRFYTIRSAISKRNAIKQNRQSLMKSWVHTRTGSASRSALL